MAKVWADNVFNRIPGKLSNEVCAVSFDYEKGETTSFSYFIGYKVAKDAPTPQHLEALIIPPQTYQKHVAQGEMTACIPDAWKKIWNADIHHKF